MRHDLTRHSEGLRFTRRLDHEQPPVITQLGWRFHHIGIPTSVVRDRETHLKTFGLHVSGFSTSPYGVEWMRFENDSPLHELIRNVPHVAFEVRDLDAALEGQEIIHPPGSPSDGVRSAMIVHNGAPVELIWFRKRHEIDAGHMLDSVHPVLMSSDVSASVRFYGRLGFPLAFQDNPVDPKYAVVTRDGVELHLQWHDRSQWAYPNDRPTYRFLIRDVDALYSELRETGALAREASPGSPWLAPGDTPWGTREFHLRDPDGNGLQFYRPRR